MEGGCDGGDRTGEEGEARDGMRRKSPTIRIMEKAVQQ